MINIRIGDIWHPSNPRVPARRVLYMRTNNMSPALQARLISNDGIGFTTDLNKEPVYNGNQLDMDPQEQHWIMRKSFEQWIRKNNATNESQGYAP